MFNYVGGGLIYVRDPWLPAGSLDPAIVKFPCQSLSHLPRSLITWRLTSAFFYSNSILKENLGNETYFPARLFEMVSFQKVVRADLCLFMLNGLDLLRLDRGSFGDMSYGLLSAANRLRSLSRTASLS